MQPALYVRARSLTTRPTGKLEMVSRQSFHGRLEGEGTAVVVRGLANTADPHWGFACHLLFLRCFAPGPTLGRGVAHPLAVR